MNTAGAPTSEDTVDTVGTVDHSDSRGTASAGGTDDPLDTADIPDTAAHTDIAGTRDTEEGFNG